jgi:HAD superfamily phosphoserine phosphatase-like hydrolase
MATIVFDFDSTIVSCESLEILLEEQISKNPELRAKIREITFDGMRGFISFEESLARRLSIAAPTKRQTEEFGRSAHQWLTLGMEELIQSLHSSLHDVWVVSGGIFESVLPLCERLKIPRDRVHAVKLMWDEKGKFAGIDEKVPFCRSKVEGCKPLEKFWNSPTIAVGDAMSDWRLFEKGMVEHFIAYTEHFRCKEVLEKGVPEAKNVYSLKRMIEEIINGKAVIR